MILIIWVSCVGVGKRRKHAASLLRTLFGHVASEQSILSSMIWFIFIFFIVYSTWFAFLALGIEERIWVVGFLSVRQTCGQIVHSLRRDDDEEDADDNDATGSAGKSIFCIPPKFSNKWAFLHQKPYKWCLSKITWRKMSTSSHLSGKRKASSRQT